MSNTEDQDPQDPYYNVVEKKTGDKAEELGEKEKFEFRGGLPRFQFHDEMDLPPPPIQTRSSNRFQSLRPVHSSPKTRSLPRRR